MRYLPRCVVQLLAPLRGAVWIAAAINVGKNLRSLPPPGRRRGEDNRTLSSSIYVVKGLGGNTECVVNFATIWLEPIFSCCRPSQQYGEGRMGSTESMLNQALRLARLRATNSLTCRWRCSVLVSSFRTHTWACSRSRFHAIKDRGLVLSQLSGIYNLKKVPPIPLHTPNKPLFVRSGCFF